VPSMRVGLEDLESAGSRSRGANYFRFRRVGESDDQQSALKTRRYRQQRVKKQGGTASNYLRYSARVPVVVLPREFQSGAIVSITELDHKTKKGRSVT